MNLAIVSMKNSDNNLELVIRPERINERKTVHTTHRDRVITKHEMESKQNGKLH